MSVVLQKNKIKIGFIGVSHWHVPLYIKWLIPTYRDDTIEVVGVSDDSIELAREYAKLLGTKAYENYLQMLDEQQPNFVYAFGRHDKMAEISHALIDRKIGFTIEKPLGLTAAEVESVLDHANRNQVFCAIPFIWRYSGLVRDLHRDDPSDFLNFSFKFIAGPPSRYSISSPWMLHKTTAGGGCMTNLGVHFIDLALYLTRSRDAMVLGADFHYMDAYDVETYGTALLKTSSGASVVLETGYAFPMDESTKRVNRWDIATRDGYHLISDNRYERRLFDDSSKVWNVETDSDPYYETFARESLNDFVEGKKPKAGLQDMLLVRRILDRINEKQSSKVQ
ncbi:MAG: Gfo/Idh/MocA family oxidoreductase [Sphaerochaeta sp.]|nr:Gfo/Idh/MocA family oxidoreductase [Sphaerochaeta sp.]